MVKKIKQSKTGSIESNLKSLISIIILISLLILSVSVNINKKPEKICNQNKDCIYNLILDSKNISHCEQLSKQNQNNNNNYRQTCYKTFAYQFQDTTFCENTNNISNCIQNIAIQTNQLEICNQLNNQTKTNNCIFQLAIKNQNQTICETSTHKSRCYYSYALETNNSDLCELTEEYQNLCKNKLH